ncbi:MAG: CarD family transcriptional regulator [Acidobacteriota bacterium]
MELSIGQKVAYPNQGVCLVEQIERKIVGEVILTCYLLRVLNDNSIIHVPTSKADLVGIRPIIGTSQYKLLLSDLGADFEDVSGDWKTRSRQFMEKLQSGDVFEAADVLKKLTFLSMEKKLSFREQNLLDKAKFLIVSEITNAECAGECEIESEVCRLVESACGKHKLTQPMTLSAAVH